MDIDNRLAGKTIEKAEIDGYGVFITFTDGSVFSYSATDGGYSSYALYGSMEEYMEDE